MSLTRDNAVMKLNIALFPLLTVNIIKHSLKV